LQQLDSKGHYGHLYRSGECEVGRQYNARVGRKTCVTEVEGTEVAGPSRRTGAAASVAAPSADHALFFRLNGVEGVLVVDGSGGPR
jgi:hypothetical protein